MSNPDSFIREVTEEVRRDRLFGYARRYGWIALALVVLLVGGAGLNEWRKARAEAAARAFGDAVLAALDLPPGPERQAALAAVPADGARAGVLRLLIAAGAVETGDRAAAAAALAAVEADAALPAAYRQLAAFNRAVLAGNALDPAAREELLAGLAAPDQPFRPLAMEQLALLRLEAGDAEAARALLRALLEEPGVTPGLRARTQQLIVALGGASAATGPAAGAAPDAGADAPGPPAAPPTD